MNKKRENQKGRYFEVISYLEEHDLFKHLQQIKVPCCYIYHYLDFNDNGDLKKVHAHILVKYGNTTTLSNIINLYSNVGSSNNINVVKSASSYYDYLTHKYNPDKQPYLERDIKCLHGFNKVDFYENKKSEDCNLLLEILETSKEIGNLKSLTLFYLKQGKFMHVEYIRKNAYFINLML